MTHMIQPHWQPDAETGFLISPAPLADLRASSLYGTKALPSAVADALENVAQTLPAWITAGTARTELEQLPTWEPQYNWAPEDGLTLERLFGLYGYCASAYVYGHETPSKYLPASIAVPWVIIAEAVGRPPMLSYTAQVLNNWRLIDARGGMLPDNLDVHFRLTNLDDERWFFVVHAAIEAHGGALLSALQQAAEGALQEEERMMLLAFRQMQRALVDITTLFHRMPEHCEPGIYYEQLRPYLFSFTDVVYEGVPKLSGPQSYRGGSGAQSSIIPAALAGLGILHEDNSLTSHLNTMRDYMPVPHQQFIQTMAQSRVRAMAAESLALRDEYNNTLRRLMTFRRAHLYYARTYIFARSTNPIGTGGTDFMQFLSQLIDETEQHLL